MHQTIRIMSKKMQINKSMLIQKENNDMLFLFHRRSLSIISFFIYNFMNLAISCNFFDCFCSMMIRVQLLVPNAKMNYVDHKFIFSGSTQSNSQM
jgi:hypothetical protein